MIIDHSFFSHPKYRIAGIDSKKNGAATSVAERIINDIEEYISIYEPRILSGLFGKEYEIVIKESPELIASLSGGDTGFSVIAAYVYFHYMRDMATNNTIAGEKLKMSDNSINASAGPRLINLWNDMVAECLRIASETSHPKAKPDAYSEIYFPINIFNL